MLTLTSKNGNELQVETSEIREMTVDALANNGLALSDTTIDLLTEYFVYAFENADYARLVETRNDTFGYNDYFFSYNYDAKRYFLDNVDDFIDVVVNEVLSEYDYTFDLANLFDSVNTTLTVLSEITFRHTLYSLIDQLDEVDSESDDESEWWYMLSIVKDDKIVTISFSDIFEIVQYQLDDSIFQPSWNYEIAYILATLFHDNLQDLTFDELNKIANGGYDMLTYCDDYTRSIEVDDTDDDYQSLLALATQESVNTVTDLQDLLYTMFECLAVAVCIDIVYICIE